MRKLGLIGGMSWVSTRTYYTHINTIIQARTDRRHSAPLLIDSLDFSKLYAVREQNGWDRAAELLTDSARRLEDAGAEMIIIAANSMHKVYDTVASAVQVPILHIAECIGEKMKEDGVATAALFGTGNVMTESFFRRRLVAHGIDLLPLDMGYVETVVLIFFD